MRFKHLTDQETLYLKEVFCLWEHWFCWCLRIEVKDEKGFGFDVGLLLLVGSGITDPDKVKEVIAW